MPEPLTRIFVSLKHHFGELHWWPAEHPFEVAVGAILTQNTAWTNVEQAIANLKAARAMSPAEMLMLERSELEALIRPAGFFRQKTDYLRRFCSFLVEQCDGSMTKLCQGTLDTARRRLLTLKGIGPETADSILLYAADRPSFVVDAYTRRVFARLGLLPGNESYASIRDMFMATLPAETAIYNEYHALIVQLAKTFCRKNKPLCNRCPLFSDCVYGHR